MTTPSAPYSPRIAPFTGTWAFFLTEARVQLHENTAIFTSMIVQAVLLIFVTILAPSFLAVALLGALVFSFFALGQRVQNEAAYIRIDHKLNQLYLASPMRPEAYFLGLAAGVLVAYLGPIVVLGVVTEVIVHLSVVTTITLVGVCAAVWVFSSSLGYIVSTPFRDQRAIWAYSSILYNVFGVLPPVFYPIGLFPKFAVPVALALPPSAASALLQETLSPGVLSPSQVTFAILALVVEAAGTFAFAAFWARKSVRQE